MVFLVGFVLGMAGLGLLIAGEVPWLGGKKVPARTARWVGAILVVFFPLVLLVRFVVSRYEDDYDINVNACYWSAAAVCVLAAVIVLVRGLPSSGRKVVARPGAALPFETHDTPLDLEMPANPFEVPPPPAAPGPKKKSKPGPKPHDPFDFS